MAPVDEDFGPSEQQRSVLTRLHKEVWRLNNADASPTFYAALRHSLAALGLSRYPAILYRVKQRGNGCEVRFRSLCGDGWQQSLPPDDRAVIELWQRGGGVRSTHEPEPDLSHILLAASRHVGQPVCSLIEIPFPQGVLGLYSSQAGTFDAADIHCLEQLVVVLTTFFRRLDDLRMLAAKESQVRQIQRLQLAGGLVPDMVLELKKPLAILLGESDLLLEKELDAEVDAAVQAINRAGLQVRATSDRIIEFVGSLRLEKEWLDFNGLVLETLELVHRVFVRKGIEIRHDMGRDMPWVHAHATQLQQVVLNLLQNSIEAIDGHRVQGQVHVRTRTRGKRVVLQVLDNGSGVCPDIAPRIFDPFFTTKPNARGGGLGLSVCAGIAAEHGGALQLEPCKMGTCMALEIPICQAQVMDRN